VKIFIPVLMAGVLALWGNGADAADARAAAEKAKTLCAGCHGPNGLSTNPLWPNLAGQKEQYLAKTLRDYQTGARSEPNMAALAQTLSGDEILNLSAYYAALPPGG
jgi:cytochrome c553